jgi:thiol-disulfide isomerase/thioredoxin
LLNNYKQGHGQRIENLEFMVSPNYPDAYENIELSNEAFLIHPNYLGINYMYAISKIDKTNDGDDLLNQLETFEEFIESQKIKEQLFYESTILLTQTGKLSEKAYQLYTKVVKNATYLDEINEIYQERKHIAQGEISPSFEFYDINNNLITLESLRGKLVYIDVWATWCIPCIQEIPALKKIEEEFKNKDICFVSICAQDTKENFEKMVTEKELGGIQLFATDRNDAFLNKFLVQLIPRFILIDKEGKIIDAYAYKPSDQKLKELLLKNL